MAKEAVVGSLFLIHGSDSPAVIERLFRLTFAVKRELSSKHPGFFSVYVVA